RVYLAPVPDDTVLIRWANQLAPETLQALNDRVVDLARSLQVTRGRKLRVDTAVVETNIHHPSDSGLLGDGVRVLSRLLRRAKTLVGAVPGLGRAVFRTRTRSVRRIAQQLHRVARRQGEETAEQLKEAYQRLIGIAKKTCAQAATVTEGLQTRTDAVAQRLVQRFQEFRPRGEQALQQAVRRVIDGE